MFESSFKVGTIAGIRIGIHYTWLIIFLLMNTSLFYVFKHQLATWNDIGALVTALGTSLVFFLSIILHELGHSIVAIRNGINVRSITLFIFGGVAQPEKEADKAIVEFKIAIAGPLVSLFLSGLFYLLRDWLGREGAPLYVSLDWLASINLVVAVFNMVPGFPLDGGRVFRAIVWGITGDEAKGMRIAVNGGRIVAYLLMILGMVIGIQTGNVLSGIWMIGIGWFLLSAADASGRAFTQGRVFSQVSISTLMEKNVPRIDSRASIESWVTQMVLPELQRAALVEEQGGVIGIVSLSDTRKMPEKEWANHTVAEIMTPVDKMHLETVDSSVDDVLRSMQKNTVNQVPIVDQHGVVGWVNRERMIHALSVYDETGRT